MNTETYLPRRFSLKTTALTALLAIAPVTVMADTQPAPARETRVAKVSLAGLDLSTPEGQHIAYDRLHATARRLCTQLEDLRSVARQQTFVKCVDETLANALRQIKGPTLAASEKSPRER